MNGASGEQLCDTSHHAVHHRAASQAIEWLEWGMRLVNDLHRLPQNAPRRQRRLLAALCNRLDADAGASAVYTRSNGNGIATRRVYFVGHELPQPTAATPDDSELAAIGAADGDPQPHAPRAWSERMRTGEQIARSLIDLGEGRISLLDLRRRPRVAARSDEKRPDPFDATSIDTLHAVHRSCAWACDASPMLAAPVVPGLSPRERETLEHLLAGASEKQVAALLRRSPHTVHSYIKRIYKQLGVNSRAELLAVFLDADGRA